MKTHKLYLALALLIAGLFTFPRASELPLITWVVGAVYTADDRDCAMLVNLTDLDPSEVTCYLTYLNKSSIRSGILNFARHHDLPKGEPAKSYDAEFINLNGKLIGYRASDLSNLYVIMIERGE